MATLSDPRSTQPTIVYDEPPVKPPPVIAVGPVAWLRENLFSSAFDTILTLITGVVLVLLVVGVFGWAITDANWFVITRNFRLFMVGTYPIEQLWRVNTVLLLSAFGIGFTMVAYLRIKAAFVAVVAALVAIMIVVPPLVNATVPPVSSFTTAGNVSVASGTITETPQTDVAFIGRAGETITIGVADIHEDDAALAGLAGFTDRATAGLVNAARNRATAIAQLETLRASLRGDLLTDAQRASVTDTVNNTTIADPVTEAYTLNSLPVEIQILDPETMTPVADGQVQAGAPPLVLTLPADGWYILRKTVVDGDGTTVLRTTGIYPFVERNLTNANEYVRVTDDFTVANGRPRIDGTNAPMLVLTDNQYQGDRSFGDYLRLSLAPLLELLGRGLIPATAVGVIGYGAGWLLGRARPRRNRFDDRRDIAQAVTPWLWIVLLIWGFVLLSGVQRFNAADLGNLIARFVWVGWMFFAGVNIQRVWGRPLLGLILVLGLIQASVAENVTIERLIAGVESAFAGNPLPTGLMNGLIGVVIWLIVGALAARQGMARADKFTQRNAILGAALSGVLWLVLFIAPPLLISAAVASDTISETTANNLMPTVDTRRWGGLLLTLVITITTILASFPIGVLLALGRRSSLPVVRWFCTGFIELVRGVPFITILFMAMLLVPLINPGLSNVDNAIRAIIGSTLFSAAYLAENVRGGLQSIPPGQEEAAKALGLSGVQVTVFITLPQALRVVIPALVGQCIALFKDTSLVALVGLTDLVGVSNGVVAQAEYIGLRTEAYVFICVIYFVFSYVMAYISRRIEASGSGAARRI